MKTFDKDARNENVHLHYSDNFLIQLSMEVYKKYLIV